MKAPNKFYSYLFNALLIGLFLISCSGPAEVQKTELAIKQGVPPNYRAAVKQAVGNLAEDMSACLAAEFAKHGPRAASLAVTENTLENGWNSLVDRVYISLWNELEKNGNLELIRPDWDFSDDIFSGLDCPDMVRRPDLKISMEIKHYRTDREFQIIADARELRSKRSVCAPQVGTISADPYPEVYETAMQNWDETQIQSGRPKGSVMNPFALSKDMGTFMARLLRCKVDLAARLWNQPSHGIEGASFKTLRYRFVGLRPGADVSKVKIDALQKALNQALIRTGFFVIPPDEDMIKVKHEIDRYDKFEDYFQDGPEAGTPRFVTAEALILGDVTTVGQHTGILDVSIRTVLLAKSMAGVSGQGLVIPELGGTCYVTNNKDPLAIRVKQIKGNNYFIEVQKNNDLVEPVKDFRIRKEGLQIFPNSLCLREETNFRVVDNNSATLNFMDTNLIIIGGENSLFKFVLEKPDELEATYSVNTEMYTTTLAFD